MRVTSDYKGMFQARQTARQIDAELENIDEFRSYQEPAAQSPSTPAQNPVYSLIQSISVTTSAGTERIFSMDPELPLTPWDYRAHRPGHLDEDDY